MNLLSSCNPIVLLKLTKYYEKIKHFLYGILFLTDASDEISFQPEDIIYDIEKIDEGWSIGSTSDGSRGMFPSNYVEMM